VGRRHSVRYFEAYIANPKQFGNAVMPTFDFRPRRLLTNLALFLEASKGAR
jgi:hypothetical protein